jgi:hypothetical protein
MKGLMAWSLAGSDLRGARLPSGLNFDLVKRAEDCSRICRNSFLAILIAAAVCWLARLTTTDVEMVVGATGPSLPFIRAEIDVVYFYFLSPFLILSMYVYFHLSLQVLWACAVNLPLYFPDGLRVDKKIYPWTLIRLSELLESGLWRRSSSTSKLRIILTGFLFWAAVPASMVAYWLHYMNQHSLAISLWHAFLVVLGLLVDMFFVWRFFELRIHSREERDACKTVEGIREIDPPPPSANLRGANLKGTDFRDSDLSGADLRSAVCDPETDFSSSASAKDIDSWSPSCRAAAKKD